MQISHLITASRQLFTLICWVAQSQKIIERYKFDKKKHDNKMMLLHNHLSTVEQSFRNSFKDEIISTWKYFVQLRIPAKPVYCSKYIFGPNSTHYHLFYFFLWLVSKYFWKIQATFLLLIQYKHNLSFLSSVLEPLIAWKSECKYLFTKSKVSLQYYCCFSVLISWSPGPLVAGEHTVKGDLWMHLKKHSGEKLQWKASVEKTFSEELQWRKAQWRKASILISCLHSLLFTLWLLLCIFLHLFQSIWSVFEKYFCFFLLNTDLSPPYAPLYPLVVAAQRRRQVLPPPWEN